MIKVRTLNARKLLTATAGLATVSYLGTTSCTSSTSSGNLMAPDGTGGEQSTGSGGDGSGGYYYTSGNLVAPEGGACGDLDQAGNGGDGGDGGADDEACIVR